MRLAAKICLMSRLPKKRGPAKVRSGEDTCLNGLSKILTMSPKIRTLANVIAKTSTMKPLNLIPSTIPLQELLRKFNLGEYQLPPFQRPFVWKIRQTLNLQDSLLRGYPIGVIYLWKPEQSSKLQPKPSTKGGPPKVKQFEAYVIDGQQRLTSLNAAFGFSELSDARGRSLECWLELGKTDDRDGRVTRLFQSPAQRENLVHDESQQQSWRVRLGDLDTMDHQTMRSDRAKRLPLDGFSTEECEIGLKRIDAVYEMLKTPITCFTITQANDEEVLAVFKRLNRGGTGLKDRDVKAADLGIGKSVEVLQDIQTFINESKPKALEFGFSFAFRALVVFHKGTAQFNQLSSKWADGEGDRGQSLRDSWREAERGLSAGMKFVDSIGWCRKLLLPSCNGLIPLAYALHRLGREPDAAEREVITRWLCLSALRGVFRGSVETTINKHLRNIKIKDGKRPVQGLMESLTANQSRKLKYDELMREPTTLWGPYSQVMFAWLVAQNAKDWLTGQSLDKIARVPIGANHPEETLTIQHIFPRKLLSNQGYEQAEANYPSNFAIIERSSNSILNDLPPTEAMQLLDSHEKREHARVQFFSTDAGDLLESDRYKDFLEWRAKRLAEAWNQWLGLKS